MLSRRLFVDCAICSAVGALASGAPVLAQGTSGLGAPGFTRTILSRIDYPGNTMTTLQVLVDVDPNYVIARHTHPGVETTSFIDGGGTLMVRGATDRAMKGGEGFQIPPGTPHALRNGPARSRLMAVYVVEKDKPLATPAPE